MYGVKPKRLDGKLVFEISHNAGRFFAVCKGWYRVRNAGIGVSVEEAFADLVASEAAAIDPKDVWFEAEEGITLPDGYAIADWTKHG